MVLYMLTSQLILKVLDVNLYFPPRVCEYPSSFSSLVLEFQL